MHTALVSRLLRDRTAWELVRDVEDETVHEVARAGSAASSRLQPARV
jgi:hypothetical protein